MPTLKAVVFDLDDTLYPEHSYVLSGFRVVSRWIEKRVGVPAELAFSELSALLQAGVREKTFDRWLCDRGIHSQRLVPQMVRVYREHRPDIRPFDETVAVLRRLRERFRTAVVSDGYLDVQKRKWAALELEDYFDVVVFSDEFGRASWKPSPVPFLAALEGLGVSPFEAVYIADNPIKDFAGARRAGMSSVRLRVPGGIYGTIEASCRDDLPDAEIAGIGELEAALERIPRRDGEADRSACLQGPTGKVCGW